MNVNDYIAFETERQSGTIREAVGMVRAYETAREQYSTKYGTGLINRLFYEWQLKGWSSLITGNSEYRLVPAVFAQGMPAIPAQQIPNAMKNLIDGINSRAAGTDFLVKEFLLIHPFADGNGRVGSLLWNYLNGTLVDPEPMPYFFGEDNA